MTHNTFNYQTPPKRDPMPAGTIFPIAGTDIRIKRDGQYSDYSSGSTCLVYRGHIESGSGIVTGKHVIIKEFYPSPGEKCVFTRQADGSLRAGGDGTEEEKNAVRQYREQFLLGLEYQKELAGSNAMEISIQPLFTSDWGDSTYVISDAHRGADLGDTPPVSLREAVSVAISLSETMGILHDNGYIMTDIKADNFLWIQKPNSVRIIDTDSLVPFRDRERLAKKPLFVNKTHWSPELEFLKIKIQEGTPANEFRRLKESMLTPLADLYSEGVIFFELFFKRLPDFDDYPAFLKKCAAQGIDGTQSLVNELIGRYGKEIKESGKNASQLLTALLSILQKLLIRNPSVRRIKGYRSNDKIISDFQEILAQLSSEKIVLRREAASANARFAAYNLLQKHPLFHYAVPAGAAASARTNVGNRPEKGEKEMRVAIIGTHVMRTDMLSAILSIGQMPDIPLIIELISKDADAFWKDYISEKNNPALARAVTWEYMDFSGKLSDDIPEETGGASNASNGIAVPFERVGRANTAAGQIMESGRTAPSSGDEDRGTDPDKFDDTLVFRPLAHLIIRKQGFPLPDGPGSPLDSLSMPTANYYIILEEDHEKRISWISLIASLASRTHPAHRDIQTFIGYLRSDDDNVVPVNIAADGRNAADPLLTGVDGNKTFTGTGNIPGNNNHTDAGQTPCVFYGISAEAFTEDYSEKMFSEKIFHMGLMAHSYYCKIMDSNDNIDMAALERDFREDLYNVTSSERCALHGVYKMAGIGIDSRKPGHFMKFTRMLADPATLEKLAWIEHLSWTAFMLTSGAVPVSMDEFDNYAYQGSNDWKDKSVPGHLRHPLLIASGYSTDNTLGGIHSPGEISPELFDKLDPLDRVSVQITEWYASNRNRTKAAYLEWLEKLTALCFENTDGDGFIAPSKNTGFGNAILTVHQKKESADPAAEVLPDTGAEGLVPDPAGTNVSTGFPGCAAADGSTAGYELSAEISALLRILRENGTDCIEKMGISITHQDPPSREEWACAINKIRELFPGRKDIQELLLDAERRIMKPVFHSFEDRDFKKNDRELTNAVIDMIT